jgi:hypothetical protein
MIKRLATTAAALLLIALWYFAGVWFSSLVGNFDTGSPWVGGICGMVVLAITAVVVGVAAYGVSQWWKWITGEDG